MDIKEDFGLRLIQFRKKKKMSQERLAELSGLNRPYISAIEQGKRNISLEVMDKLASALEIEIKNFFEMPFQRSSDTDR